MPEHYYPTVAEAVAIQRDLIDRFGGSHGIRDRKLLESAIFARRAATTKTCLKRLRR
jgi:hypothetical protein